MAGWNKGQHAKKKTSRMKNVSIKVPDGAKQSLG
jgi:hypothetical protein